MVKPNAIIYQGLDIRQDLKKKKDILLAKITKIKGGERCGGGRRLNAKLLIN